MAEIPVEVVEFLRKLDASYQEIFMDLYTSPCLSCDQKPRYVHRSPRCLEMGEELRKIISAYKI